MTTQLSIDFPPSGEIVSGPDYTFRISAPQAARVAVSIDGKDWRPARCAAGYWWYDWYGYREGSHLIRAQAYTVDGRAAALESRNIVVRLHDEPVLAGESRHG